MGSEDDADLRSAGGASLTRRRDGVLTHRLGLLLVVFCAFGVACSPRHAAEALLVGDHFALTKDVAYGEPPRQRLDVYRPRGEGRLRPVVVFLYGGRWQNGSKEIYRLLGDALTARRIVVVVPDYRFYPEVRFPAWVQDGALAVQWTHENVRDFGGDPERIVLVGHSAGAHTVTLLALDERYLASVGVGRAVRGFVSLAGPVLTTWTDADVQALMGPPEGWPESYPVNHIDGTEPPLLLLHGGADETVMAANSVGLADKIREQGGCARAIVYPDVGHVEIAAAFLLPSLRIAPVLDDVLAFIEDPGASTCAGEK